MKTGFYLPLAGVLGLNGMLYTSLKPQIQPHYLLVIVILIMGVLGTRSALRGLDWRNQSILAAHDITASKEDYVAYNNLSAGDLSAGNAQAAVRTTLLSVHYVPTWSGFNNRGAA